MREITYRRRKKTKKGMIAGALTGGILLAALIVFGLFRVQEMVIIGNDRYTATEIQEAVMSDGLCKNSLYFMWKYSDPEKAEEALPFLSSVEVEMLAPYRIQMKVYEKAEVGYIQSGGSNIYFDREGLVVEKSKEVNEGVPLVVGVDLKKADLYEPLAIEDEKLLRTVVTLGHLLNKSELTPKEIRFKENNEINLVFDKVRVLLGEGTDLDEKISALKSIYSEVETMEGTLHMEDFTETAQTVTFKQGEVEEEIQVGQDGTTPETDENGNPIQSTEPETDESGNPISSTETETDENGNPISSTNPQTGESDTGISESSGPTYSESDGSFSTDAQGNKIYTDKMGNTTSNVDQYNYTDENGNIISDGYGYIDPYTGAYILE